MTVGKAALVVTCVAVAALGGWFAVARWEDANRVATMASALGAIAAVGVAVWAAARGGNAGGGVRVSRTGVAKARGGGTANSGMRGKQGNVVLTNTGDAEAVGGEANSGIQE